MDFTDQIGNRIREGEWYIVEKEAAPSLVGQVVKVVPPSLIATNPNSPKGLNIPGRIELMVPITIIGDPSQGPISGIFRLVSSEIKKDVQEGT